MRASRNYGRGNGWTSGKGSPTTSTTRLLPQSPMKSRSQCGKFQAGLMYDVRSNPLGSYREAMTRETAMENTQGMGAVEEVHKDTSNTRGVGPKCEMPIIKVSFDEAESSSVCGQKRFVEVPSGVKSSTKWGSKEQSGAAKGSSLQVPSARRRGSIGRWTLIHQSPKGNESTAQSAGARGRAERNKESSSHATTNTVMKDPARSFSTGGGAPPTSDGSSKFTARDLGNNREGSSAFVRNPARYPSDDSATDATKGYTNNLEGGSGIRDAERVSLDKTPVKETRRPLVDGGQGSSECSGGLMAIVEKFKKDQKTSRSVVSLQQQLYQETQARCVVTESSPAAACLLGDIETFHAPFDPVICSSPKAPPSNVGFRKTPGACRPGSRSSNTNPGFGVDASGLLHPSVGNSGQFGYAATVRVPPPSGRSVSPVTSLFDPGEGGAVGGTGKRCPNGAVEVMVSNLDYNISGGEWKNILYSEFHQHIPILDIRVQTQLDNTSVAIVSVPHIDDARFTISQFHRKKIGYKRIHVSLLNPDGGDTNPPNVRSKVITILKEVVGCTMPLFMFIELYEKRYHRSITVSDLYRLWDTVDVLDQCVGSSGRMVTLTAALHQNPTQAGGVETMPEVLESPTCQLHCPDGSTSYLETLSSTGLPDVCLNLRSFGPHLHTLLQTHSGSMPLLSFQSCYAHEFSPLGPVQEGGVSLEHLITCVPGVKITASKSGVKKIQWCENKVSLFDESSGRLCSSPIMQQQLQHFSREVVDVLRNCVACRMPFDRFIPSYHHHHGRQCRVADYGYTRLVDLLDAVPHVVQIVGDGSHKLITLTHRSQVKRFILDLRMVLKAQASKQLTPLDLPLAYSKVMGKPFDIVEYGVCYIEDILAEIPESSLIVSGSGEDAAISIPRRDQSADEMERTTQFAVEVTDLLRHSPQYSMSFNKFIPAYHHHFGKQCRVSDYGFTKLIELFEAIPHVLKIDEDQEEKTLSLTGPQLLQVVGEQVVALLQSLPSHSVPVGDFLQAFTRHYGFGLRLDDFNVNSVTELMEQLPHMTKVQCECGQRVVTLADRSHTQQLTDQVLWLLMDKSEDGSLRVDILCSLYRRVFNVSLSIDDVCTHMKGIVQVSSQSVEGVVRLCPIEMFARDARTLLQLNGSQLALQQFEAAYADHFGVALVPASYGFPNTPALLHAISHVAVTRGQGYGRTVVLCRQFEGILSPMKPQRSESMQRSQFVESSGLTQMCELTKSPTEDVLDVKETTKASTPSSDSGIVEPRDDDEKDLSSVARRRLPYEALDQEAVNPRQSSHGTVPCTTVAVSLAQRPSPEQRSIYTGGQAAPWSFPSATTDSGQDLVEDCGQAGAHCLASLQFAASMLPTDVMQRPPQTPSTVHLDAGHQDVLNDHNHGHHNLSLSRYLHDADHDLLRGESNQGVTTNDWSIGHTDYMWLTDDCPVSPLQCNQVVKRREPWQHELPGWLEQKWSSSAPHVNVQLMTPDMFLPSISRSIPSASVPSESHDSMVSCLYAKEHDGSGSSSMLTSPRKCRIAARFNVPIDTSHSSK